MGLIALVIGQSNFSFLNKLSKEYGPSYKLKDTENSIKSILQASSSVDYVAITYPSIIHFPKVSSITQIAYAPFDTIEDPNDRTGREILEFMASAPLEYLEYTSKLDYFIQDVTKHLYKLGGYVGFWNYMAVIVPHSANSAESLKKAQLSLQTKKFSKDLTLFANAYKEGNAQVVEELFEYGTVLSIVHPPKEKEGWLDSIFGQYSPLKIFSQTEIFSKPDGLMMKASIASEEKLASLILEKLVQETNVSELSANERAKALLKEELHAEYDVYQLVGYSIGNCVVFSVMVMAAFLLPEHRLSLLAWGVNAVAVHFYTSYKYYNAGTTILHTLVENGNLQMVAAVLNYEEGRKLLEHYNREGETALHIAAQKNWTNIALFLTQKGADANVRDYSGKLPVHYAAENKNYDLTAMLLSYCNTTKSVVENPGKLAFDHIVFWANLFYLGTVFQDFGGYLIFTWGTLFLAPLNTGLAIVFGRGINPLLLDFGHRQENFDYYNMMRMATVMVGVDGRAFGQIAQLEHPLAAMILSFYGVNISNSTNLDKSFQGYSHNGLLHIVANNSSASLLDYLLTSGMEVNARNSRQETPLHIAASVGDYESVVKLVSHGARVNENNLDNPYLLLNAYVLIRALTMPAKISFWAGTIDRVAYSILAKVMYEDSYFSSLQGKNMGTPLVRSLVGDQAYSILEEKYILNQSNALNLSETRIKIIEFLIRQGANTDEELVYHLNYENTLIKFIAYSHIPLILSKFPLFWVVLGCIVGATQKIDFLQDIFPHEAPQVKAIDFLDKANRTVEEEQVYGYLKQHTILHPYIDVQKMSYVNYLCYMLGAFSDEDVIEMNTYGAYKGGSGRDIFRVYPGFLGKGEGWKVFIKDYSSQEDILDLTLLREEVRSAEDLKFEAVFLNDKQSTVISKEDGEEVVTLYGFLVDQIGDIQFKFWEVEVEENH